MKKIRPPGIAPNLILKAIPYLTRCFVRCTNYFFSGINSATLPRGIYMLLVVGVAIALVRSSDVTIKFDSPAFSVEVNFISEAK